MSTTNTTNQQGSDAPKASENKPEAEKLPTTTTTAAEGGEQTKQQDVVSAVEPTPESNTTAAKTEGSSGEAAKATETKSDAASSDESKPEAMDVTSAEETKSADNNAASGEESKPVAGDASTSEVKATTVSDATNEKDGDKLPRLRFNGAARKRFRWLLDHGYSRDDAESLAKEPVKFKELRDKAEEKPTVTQNEKQPANKKRSRTDGPKGPSVDGPPNKMVKQELNNTGGIRMTVAPKDYPVSSLTKEQGSTIKSAILKQVVQQKDAAFKPRFEDCVFLNGYLLVHCSDHLTRQWLQKIVSKLELWENASVKTVSENNLLKVDVYIGYFTDSLQDSNKDILDFVESQNDGISTSKWKVISRKEVTQKQTIELTFTVDAASAKIIHNESYQLNYKFKKVLIRKKNKPVAVGSTNANNNNRGQSNINRGQSNNNRGLSNSNRGRRFNSVPSRQFPREQRTSSSFVPIWDSNLPKGGNYMRAPNPPKWSVTDQRRGSHGADSFDRNRNVGSSDRNSNSNLYDAGSRNGSYGGNSYGSSYSGGAAQSSASRSLNLINSLYDQLRRTVASSSGSNLNRQEYGRSSLDSFDRYGSRLGNGTGGGSSSYNFNSGRSSNMQDKRNTFKPSKFF